MARRNHAFAVRRTLCALLCVVGFAANAQAELVKFDFEGIFRVSNSLFNADDTFSGSYTFDTSAAVVTHPDATLNIQSMAISPTLPGTGWHLTVLSSTVGTFELNGTTGWISVGNDIATWGDRYVASLFDAGPLPGGLNLNFFQIDLGDLETAGHDMLSDEFIGSFPDISKAERSSGRFFSNDSSFLQAPITITSLTVGVVPCPATPAPAPAGSFLSPTVVSIAGTTLRMKGCLDIGQAVVDWETATTVTIGAEVIAIPAGGFESRRRGTQFRWRSADRKKDVIVVLARRGSRARIAFLDRDSTAAADGALALGFANDDVSAVASVGVVSGKFRAGRELLSEPPLTLSRLVAIRDGGGDDRGMFTAEFGGDGTVPATAPDLNLRVGDWAVCVPDVDHVVTGNAQGYRYAIPDPDGTGPELAQGAWFVDVNFVRQQLRVFFRGADLGMFDTGDVPLTVSFGVNGVENAVEVLASNSAGGRMLYR